MTINTKEYGKKAKKENVRQNYMATFSRDESIQVLDCGSSIQLEPNKACGKKAALIVSMLAKEKIGYKLEMKNLLYKKWRKWVLDAASFTTADVISASDVKEAIREFYRLVSIGELTWADGNLRMLEMVQHIDGLLEVRVAPFVPGLFTLKGAKAEKEVKAEPAPAAPANPAKAEEANEEIALNLNDFSKPSKAEERASASDVEAVLADVDVLASVRDILKGHISVAERAILSRALDDLQKLQKVSA